MGKEWLYWVGGGSGGGGGGGGSGRSSTKRGRMSGEMKEAAASAGCMCAVFQLFDLHQFQSRLNQQNPSDFHPDNPFLQEEATTSKGVEAPRNSLELEEPAAMNAASMSLAMKEEENLNFPAGIQIKTGRGKISSPRVSTSASKSRSDDFSSECSSNSPGTKTPSLVARLMGLDLLPECSSPSISSSSSKPQIKSRLHQNHHQRKDGNFLQSRSSRSFFDDDLSVGARSLPETPRISSARRSDVEYHRLSLQINKENISEEFAHTDKMVARRGRFRLQPQDENRSPGHYAKQIVKHVKESVSRRVGHDITNTSRNRELPRRDENLILLKPTKKNSKILSRFEGEINPDGKQSVTPSWSPRLRFLDPNKNKTTNSGTKSPRVSLSSDNHQPQGILKPKPQAIIPLQEQQQQQQKDSKKVGSTGKCSSSRLKKLPPQASDHAIRNKKEEPFVSSTATNKASLTDKKSKRTPLLSDIINVTGPTLLQVKKDPSPPPTKLPQKQSQVSDALSSKRSTQLSSNPSHSYKQLQLHPDKIFRVPKNVLPDSANGCATATPAALRRSTEITSEESSNALASSTRSSR
ncbi:hypothetical protein Pfo_014881 [Paulownia fortunei]|nr:hypothetical protein Pfo_014881 [Paulownia fortunei]